VRNCDLVVFLSQGEVVVEGTFEEVRAQSEEFAHLVTLGSLDGTSTSGPRLEEPDPAAGP
jgi:ABC-type Na+ transport system ATPase subunit NatA